MNWNELNYHKCFWRKSVETWCLACISSVESKDIVLSYSNLKKRDSKSTINEKLRFNSTMKLNKVYKKQNNTKKNRTFAPILVWYQRFSFILWYLLTKKYSTCQSNLVTQVQILNPVVHREEAAKKKKKKYFLCSQTRCTCPGVVYEHRNSNSRSELQRAHNTQTVTLSASGRSTFSIEYTTPHSIHAVSSIVIKRFHADTHS